MRSKMLSVAIAALLVSALARAAVDLHVAATATPASATLKVTCMSDGSMKIASDALAGTP